MRFSFPLHRVWNQLEAGASVYQSVTHLAGQSGAHDGLITCAIRSTPGTPRIRDKEMRYDA